MARPFMIIATDNAARESVADQAVVVGIPDTPQNRAKAKEVCDWINTFSCVGDGGTFHKVVEGDYRLSRGMEDLV